MYFWLATTYRQLAQRCQQKTLHHALLLQGPQGIGKTDFCQQLAGFMLCSSAQAQQACGHCQACLLFKAGNHPDFHEVRSEKQIGVDQIREAISKLSGSAQLSGAKVLVIYAAHTMTESAANALLKTLEEPTGNTFLLLLSHQPERLLATIQSRCERVNLPVPTLEQTQQWLSTQWDGELDQDFVALYATSPLTLLAELQQEGLSYQDFKQALAALLQHQINPAQLATDWQEQVEKVLKWLQFWLAQQVRKTGQLDGPWWQIQQQAVQAIKRARHPGINKVLLLSQLLGSIAAMPQNPSQLR